ncbi:MAG: glucose-6-phosphate dehydrogenase [Candidatus Saccharibacteria bacterium]
MVRTKLIIFGITGDLSRRKLLPALKRLEASGNLKDTEIIGVSRRQVDVGELLREAMGDSAEASAIIRKTRVFSMDLAQAGEYQRLKVDIAAQLDDRVIIYLSVPPRSSVQIAEFLGLGGFNTPNVRLLLEKPFGVDLVSALEAITRIDSHFRELQVYRIDHYLAKEMAQNIVAFRGGNALFSAIWDSSAIERIEVVALETIGIEGRVDFYEQTGALRDVLQGHLMQLLALSLMDIPTEFNWDVLPSLRHQALQQLRLANPAQAHRAQYDGYQAEVGQNGSQTETFVSVGLVSDAPQWQGVPIRLTTGKALDSKTTEVRIHLRKHHEAQSNLLVFRIQPNEGIEIDVFSKKPGYDQQFEVQKLKYSYPTDAHLPDAYEQVIVDAIRGKKNLFTEGKEVIRSWQVLQPILDHWEMDEQPLPIYAAGSSPDTILRQ